MCVIAGCHSGQDIVTVNRMFDMMRHHGPDDRGASEHGERAFY